MEIFYFESQNESVTRCYCRASCFFIPNENILFVKENMNGIDLYALVTDKSTIDEARTLFQGKDPYEQERSGADIGMPSFSHTKKIEIPDDKIYEILENLRQRDLRETKIKRGIEDILGNIHPK